jgi:glutaredoxin
MAENNNVLKALFSIFYTKKIILNKEEFRFRLMTHTNYPKLSSILDTLEYFEIDHGVYEVEFKEIDLTPNDFLVFLKGEYNIQDLHHVKKHNHKYLIDSKKSLPSDLERGWSGLVIDIEDSLENTPYFSRRYMKILAIVLILFLSLLTCQINLSTILFLIFPISGFLLSLIPLKSILKINDSIFNKFCGNSKKTSCEKVITSKKSIFTRLINFSDLSIIFFSSQLVGFFIIIGISGFLETYFTILKYVLILSLPILLISLYVQKYVEKMWCPACLGIITTIFIELLYLNFWIKFPPLINYSALYLFLVVVLISSVVWLYIKKLSFQLNQSQQSEMKLIRFVRNYSKFKSALLKKGKYDLSMLNNTSISRDKIYITVFTDPFCDHCSKTHKALEKIISKNKLDIVFDPRFKIDIEEERGDDKTLCRNFAALQLDNNGFILKEALSEWFDQENMSKWLNKYSRSFDEKRVDEVLNIQNQWCLTKKLDFTPILFINEYFYPLEYDIEYLDYFIQDLINDNDIVNTEILIDNI